MIKQQQLGRGVLGYLGQLSTIVGWKDIVLEGNGISQYTKYQNVIIHFGQVKKFGTVITSSLGIGYAQVEGETRQMGRVRS